MVRAKNKFKKMPWIAFLGADGSGKSTVIDNLTDYLNGKEIAVSYHHWRPVLGDKKEGGSPVSDPHAEPARGLIPSWCRLLSLLGVWWVCYFKQINKLRKAGQFIIFDRFYADLLADPRRYRYGGGRLMASVVFKLMPKPNLVILLDADAEVLFARKPEVEMEMLRGVVENYRMYIKNTKNGILINSDQKIEKVLSDTFGEIEKLLD